MSYNAYVTVLKNVRKHPNADRLLLAECFGNTVCVSLEYTENEIGVYFPVDGQLSIEFAEQNNLLRKKDINGNNIGGYMDPDKRNVQAIRLRGEKSDGLFLPLSCLKYTNIDLDSLHIGDLISVVNGHEICKKYIPKIKTSLKRKNSNSKKTKKEKINIAPLFKEHVNTDQLAYNLSAFKPGDEIEITLKMHGTSQRTGFLPILKGYKAKNWFWNLFLKKNNFKKGKIFSKFYEKAFKTASSIYDWGYVSGTRKTVLDNFSGGFYGSNEFRKKHCEAFENKLLKGETFYYEVCGWANKNAPIMGVVKNKKVGKDFVKLYGNETVFSYGCNKGESAMYVYRVTMTNEDGDVIEYSPDFMRYRCEQMGLNHVPVFWRGFIPKDVDNAGEWVMKLAEQFYDGPDPIGKTHVREGVVIRILNRPSFTAYKFKNFNFKCLSGIAIENIEKSQTEISQDILSEM